MNVRKAISLGVLISVSLLPLGIAGISPGRSSDTALSPEKWSGWQAVPNGGVTDAAPFAIGYGGKLYLFAKGIGNRRIYVNTYTSAGWSGVSLLHNDVQTNVEISGAVCNNKLEIYAIPNDPYFGYVHRFENNGNWWNDNCPDVNLPCKHICVIADGPAVYLFMTGYSNDIYYWLDNTYHSQIGPAPIPPGNATTDVALGGCVWQGLLWLFGKGIGDSRLYYTYYKEGGWAGTWWLFSTWLMSDVAPVMASYDNILYVFLKEKLTNRIYGLWSRKPLTAPWSIKKLSGPLTAYGLSAAVYNGKLYLFAVAGDQTLMYNVLKK